MQKSNKVISFLLCVLIILSATNLFLGVTNSYRIKQLESAPPVIIDTLKESTAQVTEPSSEDITTAETAVTTAESTTVAEPVVTESESTVTEPTEQTTKPKPTESEAPQNENGYCYVTASGTKYHKDGCSYLKKSKTKMTVNEAESCGYSPCSRCY
ncbi:MAG: hypothetical protein IJB93_05225 [Clostridia bacterium]|nr:hypothetical protein [Clostridia bacterium]